MNLWLKSIGVTEQPICQQLVHDSSDEDEFRWHGRMSVAYSGTGIVGPNCCYLAFIENVDTRRIGQVLLPPMHPSRPAARTSAMRDKRSR